MTRTGIVYLLAAVVQGFALLAVTPFATRILGPAEYGQVALAVVITSTLVNVLAAGFPQLILRDHQQGEEGEYKARASVGLMHLTGLGITVVGSAGTAALAGASLIETPALWLAIVVGAGALTCITAGQAVFRARGNAIAFALLAFASTFGAMLVGIVTAWITPRAEAYLAGYTMALVLTAVTAVAVSGPVWPWRAPTIARSLLRPGVSMLPYGVAMLALLSGDTVIAGMFRGPTGAATYQPALMLGNIAFFTTSAIFNAWGPAVYRHPLPTRWTWTGRTAVLLAVGLAAIGTVVALTTPLTVPVLVGSEFDRSTIQSLVGILAWTAVPYVVYLASFFVLVDHGKTGGLALLASGCALLFVVSGSVLTRFGGLEYLAVAKLLSYSVLALATRFTARRYAGLPLRGWPLAATALLAILSVIGSLIDAAVFTSLTLAVGLVVLAFAAWHQKSQVTAVRGLG